MAVKFKIKKGDKVVVRTGKDKGKSGEVLRVLRDEARVLVQGVKMVKRHTRPAPGTPGGIMTMLAEFGTMSLGAVLAPAIEMADGFAIDEHLVDTIEQSKAQLKQWPDSRRVMLPHLGAAHEAPEVGEIFRRR